MRAQMEAEGKKEVRQKGRQGREGVREGGGQGMRVTSLVSGYERIKGGKGKGGVRGGEHKVGKESGTHSPSSLPPSLPSPFLPPD